MVNRLVLSRKQVQWHLNPWSVAANLLQHAFNCVAIAIQAQNTEVSQHPQHKPTLPRWAFLYLSFSEMSFENTLVYLFPHCRLLNGDARHWTTHFSHASTRYSTNLQLTISRSVCFCRRPTECAHTNRVRFCRFDDSVSTTIFGKLHSNRHVFLNQVQLPSNSE